MTESFDSDWLALREPVDFASRSAALADAFLDTLPARPRIMDLGAGTGSNARYLNARAAARAMEIDWLLVDGDPALLDRVTGVTGFERQVADFATDPAVIDLAGVDGVSASALFDLVSRGWFHDFVDLLGGRPFLAALTADGGHHWNPPDPDDAAVESWFEIDMSRDKGFGAAMGLQAPDGMETILEAAGYTVRDAETPWMLKSDAAGLVTAMVDGVAAAARRHGDGARVDAWRQRRLVRRTTHGVNLRVQHRDILAFMALTRA